MKIRALSLIGFAFLVACSSGSDATNNPPVLDSVEGPAETTAMGTGQAVTFDVRWHDDDKDAITSVRYRVAELNIDQSTMAAGASANTIGASLTLIFPAAVPKKAYDIVFTAIDARGAESAAVTKNVTVK
jgi:hypothetical protein